MEYVRVATINDFTRKNTKSFSLLGKKVALIRRSDGTFLATEIGCKHQGADLSSGKIEGVVVTCPLHGWRYDLESGKCLNHSSPDLRRYGVRLEGADIYVSLLPLCS